MPRLGSSLVVPLFLEIHKAFCGYGFPTLAPGLDSSRLQLRLGKSSHPGVDGWGSNTATTLSYPVLSGGSWVSHMWDTGRLCRWRLGHSYPHRFFVLFSYLGSLDLVSMNVPTMYSGVSSVVTSFCYPGV